MQNRITLGDAPVSQQFGVNPAAYARFGLPGHNGLDLAVPTGTQLYSPVAGTITEIGTDGGGYGLYVKLTDDFGGCWLLAHLSDVGASKEGDRVAEMTPIALSGSTGNSTGPHVHAAYRPWCSYRATPYDGWVDPEPYLALLGQ